MRVPEALTARGSAFVTSRQKAEADHAARGRPAVGLMLAAGLTGLTDHDRAVSVHARGSAFVTSRQKAEADHAARGRPAEGFETVAAGIIAKTDHDRRKA